VKGLRILDAEGSTIEQAIRDLEGEVEQREGVKFIVSREGEIRPLRPAVHEEVSHIGREAVLNAWKHAKATEVTVCLEYRPDRFRMEITDDGIGMDPIVADRGREGHWGLKGMRERAEKIGGRLQIVSQPGRGTRVEFNLPAKLAFNDQRKLTKPRLFGPERH